MQLRLRYCLKSIMFEGLLWGIIISSSIIGNSIKSVIMQDSSTTSVDIKIFNNLRYNIIGVSRLLSGEF